MKLKFNSLAVLLGFVFGAMAVPRISCAEVSSYPEFAQHKLPENVTPAFISIDELVAEVKAGSKPLIVDVRSAEEFQQGHILGSISAPLQNFASYAPSMPKDRLLVLY